MNFLDANRILTKFKGGPSLRIRFAASGNVDPLLLYVRAAAAMRGRSAELSTIPFGTLGQALVEAPSRDEQEVILLMPWDFVAECDWRSGIPLEAPEPGVLLASAREVSDRLGARGARLIYLPAPLPPLYTDPAAVSSLSAGISGLASALGAHFLPPAAFGLGNYLASGVPVSGSYTDEVVESLLSLSLGTTVGIAKVLVTDLDNVLWAGLAGEDGVDGVQCAAEGIGFRHFLYQGLLAKLKAGGVLLAAVSRNDLELARAPITADRTLLSETDFVAVLASFEPKSVHIRRLAENLNLGLDAFVFVDDNPVELAEVGAALPAVRCVRFPDHDDQLAHFLHSLAGLFARRTISREDRERTEMYRRRLAAGAPSSVEGDGADLSEFLAGLKMELTIFDRSSGDRDRAVQLINKTNQFNLNGRRMPADEIERIIADGGRLYTAKLDDRTGTHGEILACLIDSNGRIVSLVLSCRVFQRRVEHAFLSWLVRRSGSLITLDYAPTERNTPLREFLKGPGFTLNGDAGSVDGARFLAEHESDLGLFALTEVGVD